MVFYFFHLFSLRYWSAEIYCCVKSLKQKIIINQKINREILSGKTTTPAANRSVFQTVVVLKIQRLRSRSHSFVSFLIQDTLKKKGILSPENTKTWERECYDIPLCIANVDIKLLEKKYF